MKKAITKVLSLTLCTIVATLLFASMPAYANGRTNYISVFAQPSSSQTISEESKETRAICYKCGKNSMTLKTWKDDVRGNGIACPYSGAEIPDQIFEFINYYGDFCNSCGLLNKYSYPSWIVKCQNSGLFQSDYNVILGATLDQGYNSHVCIAPYTVKHIYSLI